MGKGQQIAAERRAKFCQYIHAGQNQREAARSAGYTGTDKSLNVKGAKLMKHPDVVAHLAKLRERGDAEAVATRDELLKGLTADWRRDLGPYMRFDAAGRFSHFDLEALNKDGKTHWIEELTYEEYKGGAALASPPAAGDPVAPEPARRVKVKLVARHGAADRLAKLLGMNAPERHQHQHEYPGIGTKDPAEMTPAERAAERKALAAKLAELKKRGADGATGG